ncbi:MAG: hypothetical protein RIE73_32690 [Coleofasciculus sp. C1-SOL-03]|uniref:hypothetical protein n=1 Tax=Coleofasciculus sp. C1-SOL-03 TaxID=3069522 RepID=UPI0032FFCCC8
MAATSHWGKVVAVGRASCPLLQSDGGDEGDEGDRGDGEVHSKVYLTCSLLPIAYCLLPIAYCLLPIAYSLTNDQ